MNCTCRVAVRQAVCSLRSTSFHSGLPAHRLSFTEDRKNEGEGGDRTVNGTFRKPLARWEQPNSWLRLPSEGKSRSHPPRARQIKARKRWLTRRILPSAQTASEYRSMRPRDRGVAKGA